MLRGRGTDRPAARAVVSGLVLTAGLLMALMTACAPPTVTAPPMVEGLAFPSPLAGPGTPSLDPGRRSTIQRGWSLLARGETVKAAAAARSVGDHAAARLLELQIDLHRETGGAARVVSDLEHLVQSHPAYAAAWATLSVAAEKAGSERTALEAARRTSELWTAETWSSRTRNLEQRWIDERLRRAETALDQGDADTTLALADQVLELDTERHRARLLAARAHLSQGETAEAEAALAPIAREAPAAVLLGDIAERRQDWQTAMTLYESLPPDHPERAELLHRARSRWRLANAAPWVREALEAEHLTRAQLATLLVALMPQLLTVAGDEVPVLSDIVELPNQADVVTVARLGLMEVDPLEHRFRPNVRVTVEQARDAVDALAHLLGLPAPVWCSDTVVTSCLPLDQPITGSQLAAVVMTLARATVND